ncbi:MAG: protease-like activity factor CPAF [Elusimicrobia bacterium]|nr:protease-like activity factor CPAF [Elusimicrobiota bacterium]
MPSTLKRSKEAVAASLSLLILLASPGWPQTVTQAVPGMAGNMTAVPVNIGTQLQSPALKGLPGTISLNGVSVLPTPSAISVQTVKPQAANALAPAAGVNAKANKGVPAISAAPVANVAVPGVQTAVETKLRAEKAAVVQGLSKQVGAAIEAAGPVREAPAESAHGLGRMLIDMLTFSRAKGASDSAAVPRVPKRTSSKKMKAAGLQKPGGSQRQMLQALDYIASVYTEHYAPIDWKQQQFGVDFKKEYEKVRSAVLSKPSMSFREFQSLLAAFVSAARDYHVGIHFYSTEKARLPLFIMGAEGRTQSQGQETRYYLAYIDRQKLPERLFPHQVGDEVVEFDGRPVAEVIEGIVKAGGQNVPGTDARLAEMRLTNRIRQTGQPVPQGAAALKIRGRDGAVSEVKLGWEYTPEMVPGDVPVRDGGLSTQSGIDGLPAGRPGAGAAPAKGLGKVRELLRKLIPVMAHPFAEIFKKHAAEQPGNKFMIGARESFVPKLGKVLWEIPQESPIHAYIYENEQGRKIGYIRIPDFMGEEQHAQLFAQIIGQFQKVTDGLVIDQVNNPGGSLFYMYALLSMLSDKPLDTPRHRLIIDESDAYWAASILQQTAAEGMKKAFTEEMGEEMAGFKPTRSVQESVIEYARFILAELKAGRRFTEFVHLFGIDSITPGRVRYAKPILLLINELDFSCADFFPAILRDNGRAKLLGARTAGAGGGVKELQFANQLGVAGFSYTWTIAQRPDGRPIENLGVNPDVEYQLTGEDFRAGFSGYQKAVNAALNGMLPPPAPRSAPAVGDEEDAAPPPAVPLRAKRAK